MKKEVDKKGDWRERFEYMERNHEYIPEHKERIINFIATEIQSALEGQRMEWDKKVAERLDQLSLCMGDEWSEGQRYSAVQNAKTDIAILTSLLEEKKDEDSRGSCIERARP